MIRSSFAYGAFLAMVLGTTLSLCSCVHPDIKDLQGQIRSLNSDLAQIRATQRTVQAQTVEYRGKLSGLVYARKKLQDQDAQFFENRNYVARHLQQMLNQNLQFAMRGEDMEEFKYYMGTSRMPRPTPPLGKNRSLPLNLKNSRLLNHTFVNLQPYEELATLSPLPNIMSDHFVYVDFCLPPFGFDLKLNKVELYSGDEKIDAIGVVVFTPAENGNPEQYVVRKFGYYTRKDNPHLFGENSTDGNVAGFGILGFENEGASTTADASASQHGVFSLDFLSEGTLMAKKGDRWGIVLPQKTKIPCDYITAKAGSCGGDVRLLPFDIKDAHGKPPTVVYDFSQNTGFRAEGECPTQETGLLGQNNILSSQFAAPELKAAISFGVYGSIIFSK